MKECPICGLGAIDVTVHGNEFPNFLCVGGHRWELRPQIETAPEIPPEIFKPSLFRRIVEAMRITPRRNDPTAR